MVVFERTASPLSELDIKRVEKRLGIRLPQDLKEHYLRHNGGRPRPGFFPKDGDAYGIDEFLPMNTDGKGTNFEETYVMMVDQGPEFPRGYIPFADDRSGDIYIYSVRPESFGNIAIWVHEHFDQDDQGVEFLAPTLKEFIDSFVEEPDDL